MPEIGWENLQGFCVARTFMPVYGGTELNRQVAHCKICGERLEKGLAVKYVLAHIVYSTGGIVFLCQKCSDYVVDCRGKFVGK